jgi:hypothetical protein
LSLEDKIKAFEEYTNMPVGVRLKRVRQFQASEVGFRHPSGATIRARDDGAIQMTAGKTGEDGERKSPLTFRLNPAAQSANLYSPKFNVYSDRVNFHVQPDGFWINYRPLNPVLMQANSLIGNPQAAQYLQSLFAQGFTAADGRPIAPATGAIVNSVPYFLSSRLSQEATNAAKSLAAILNIPLPD